MRNITYIEFAQVFSDEQAGAKPMRLSFLARLNSWVPIRKCETEIPINKRSVSPSIKRTQFLLILAWPSTIYKVQGSCIKQGLLILICKIKKFLAHSKHIPRSEE